MPVEPPPSEWEMPDPSVAGDGDLVGVGADLQPGTLLAAYRRGMFPMPVDGRLAWWSPAQRAIVPLHGLRVSRSLRRSCARYELRIDTAFDDVIGACAATDRRGGWIDANVRVAYSHLHELGWAHSVEAWTPEGDLVGGLYGVAIGGVFAGESMFYRTTDASKVALVGLVELLLDNGGALLDVQWQTDHLASLGAIEVTRDSYRTMLAEALERPLPAPFR
ncbi:MAG: leucyl/phenylalanyl-tRNA--protein transferase [Acidimicrobiales bacterium]